MEVLRKIGRHEILVETSEPCGLYFEPTALPLSNGSSAVSLEKTEILNLLANGDDYFPLTLHWELLDRCNLACPFCYIVGHSSNRVIRFAEIQQHLADLVKAGLLFCTVTGGESTIHPDFKDIYRFLKDQGVIVEVFTNGLGINDALLELFRSHPPIAVEVSIYTLSDEVLRDRYGEKSGRGASQILNNILRMKNAGVHVVCKTFLNTVTASEFNAVSKWCKENALEHYSSSELTKAYDGADLSRYAVKRQDVGISLTQNSSRRSICLPCRTKNYGSAITPSFSIYPCPSIKLADCTFDLRQYGVTESIRRMKAFMRQFQDTEIRGGGCGTSECASCMAYAKPVRDDAGKLLFFSQH